MLIYLLDEMPDFNSIKSIGKRCFSNNVDMVNIQMSFPKNNIICNLYTSWVDNEKKRHFSVITKTEKLTYNDIFTNKSIKINFSNIQKNNKQFIYNFKDELIPLQKYDEPIRKQLIHYHDCLIDNKIKCKTDCYFALKVNKIMSTICDNLIIL